MLCGEKVASVGVYGRSNSIRQHYPQQSVGEYEPLSLDWQFAGSVPCPAMSLHRGKSARAGSAEIHSAIRSTHLALTIAVLTHERAH